jgi:hypothetical protein
LRKLPSSTRLPRSDWKISESVGAAHAALGGALRMRHHAQHRALGIDHAAMFSSEPFGLLALVTLPSAGA